MRKLIFKPGDVFIRGGSGSGQERVLLKEQLSEHIWYAYINGERAAQVNVSRVRDIAYQAPEILPKYSRLDDDYSHLMFL